jgi:hypothetical protein
LLSTVPAAVTIEFWFNPTETIDDTLAETVNLVTKFNLSSYDENTEEWNIHGFNIGIFASDGRMYLYVPTGNVYGMVATTTDSWVANTWYHVVAVIDPTRGLELWINGVKEGFDVTKTTLPSNGNNYDFYVGCYWWDGSYAFTGKIDELRVSSIARTTGEIAAAYNSGSGLALTTDSDTLALYHFNETSGTVADNDVATQENLPTFVSGKVGQAFSFNGTDSYVDCGSNDSLSCAVPRTITPNAFGFACWVKRNALGTEQVVISKWNTTGDKRQYRVSFTAANQLKLELGITGGADSADTVSVETIEDTSWHFIAVSWRYDRNAGKARILIDGEEATYVTQDALITSFAYLSNGENVYIGKDAQGNFFSGLLDEVILWANNPSNADLLDLYDHAEGKKDGDRFIVADPEKYWDTDTQAWVEQAVPGDSDFVTKEENIVEWRDGAWVFVTPRTAFVTWQTQWMRMIWCYPDEYYEVYGDT